MDLNPIRVLALACVVYVALAFAVYLAVVP